eukprot:Lithocolla_globosa_v1_NODE_4237_length_1481_cov_30.877279.p2 type:complete len:125 gc:universal NODE_4237_length_1481_cov_30.877279:496-870(+)
MAGEGVVVHVTAPFISHCGKVRSDSPLGPHAVSRVENELGEAVGVAEELATLAKKVELLTRIIVVDVTTKVHTVEVVHSVLHAPQVAILVEAKPHGIAVAVCPELSLRPVDWEIQVVDVISHNA